MEKLADIIWEMCNKIWKKEKWIEKWNEGLIMPIRKKSEEIKISNYKGVTVTKSLYKICHSVTGKNEKKIKEKDVVLQNQTNFRNDNV